MMACRTIFPVKYALQLTATRRSFLQLGVEFAMRSLLRNTKRAAFRNHGSCWGGGVGRVMTSFELKQVESLAYRPGTDKAACSTTQYRVLADVSLHE